MGPWYRWHSDGGNVADTVLGRTSRPIFQKYATSDFVTDFLAEPQTSLKFLDEDYVHKTLGGKNLASALSGHGYTRTDVKKIFLPMHSRFYLVVCELHCDLPGFPPVNRKQVAQAGFVVRKQVLNADPETKTALAQEMGRYKKAQVDLSMAQKMSYKKSAPGLLHKGMGMALQSARKIAVQKRAPRLAKELSQSRNALKELMAKGNAEYVNHGWRASQTKGIGCWETVDETPEKEIAEVTCPLYPLIPDPSLEKHSAWKQSIWFGILPVSSSELDEIGNPRFDDRSCYHVRCFVRQHETCDICGKKKPGPLVWSDPTPEYQIASQQDLIGTSNRPVTIQMPDLPQLSAQAASLAMGDGAGVRMEWPDNSFLKFGEIKDGLPDPATSGIGGASICFFSIPLITIVATFVLKLFLPIVVFIFGLWFLLKLRFCIPPTFSLDVELKALIDVEGGDIEASLSAQIDLNGSFSVKGQTFYDVNDAGFKQILKDEFKKIRPEIGDHIEGSVNDLGNLLMDMQTDFSADFPEGFDTGPDPNAAPDGPRLPKITDRLVYYDPVEVPKS